MKRVLIFLLLLALTACTPAPLTLVPVDTLVAQTIAAMPKTDTSVPPRLPTDTATLAVTETPKPLDINTSAPGAECIPTSSERIRALVTHVLDGSTIEVVVGNDIFQVKYIGLVAPSSVHPLEWQGPQAFAANNRLVSGQFVTLIKDNTDTDAAGFLPRYVMVGDIFLNYELARQGLGKVVITPPDMACEATLLAAQAEAQAAVLGVWAPTPIPSATITPTPTITRTPTNTTQPVCNCDQNYSCASFPNQASAQACYKYCNQQGKFVGLEDKNHNGQVCEGLP